jgi:acylpyruvate hydrolase
MKIICIGRNYVDHAKELSNPVPKQPLIFMKPSTALLINNSAFYYPDFSKNIHYEGELVLRVCRNGRHIQPAFAASYYDQLAFGIDFTARDLQDKCKEKGHPWEIAKAFDHSAAVSSFINIPKDVEDIHFELKRNGQSVQNGHSKDLIFNFNYLICHISKYFKLHIGDYIFTGTPAGVGPVQIGDQLEGFIEGEKLLHCDIK